MITGHSGFISEVLENKNKIILALNERNKQLQSAAKLALIIAEAHIADIKNDETRALMMAELDSVRELVGGGE